MRTCPRCGAQVEVYRSTCDCGFSWVPSTSTESGQDIYTPGEFRPIAVLENRRRVPLWPWVLGILLMAVGAWHFLCTEKLEASIHEYIKSNVGEMPGNTTIEIHIQPVTNLVAIDLKVVDKAFAAIKPDEKLLLDAMLSLLRSELEPYLERELSLMARKQIDPYAMALQYRIAFSLRFSSK